MRCSNSHISFKQRIFLILLIAGLSILLLFIILSDSNNAVRWKPSEETHPQIKWNSVNKQSFYTPDNITPPAVLLKPKGGIGNQLFQYACHYALARKHGWPLYIMLDYFLVTNKGNRDWGVSKREFALNQFNIPLFPWNMVNESWSSSDLYGVSDSMILNGNYPKDKIIVLGGADFCQSEVFFFRYKNELMDLFTPKNSIDLGHTVGPWLDRIESSGESVAIHIRRGDFKALNRTLPLNYFFNSIKKIRQRLVGKKLTFFLFSDDANYLKRAFGPLRIAGGYENDLFLVSDPGKTNSLQELYLMSKCKHQIIPDSSFSWWGAYLDKNQDKIVYAAHQKPVVTENFYGQDEFYGFEFQHIYYPTGWIQTEV